MVAVRRAPCKLLFLEVVECEPIGRIFQFGGFVPSPVPKSDLGRFRSRQVRSRKADKLLWEIRREVLTLARAGNLGATLKDIGEQLNSAGLRTNQNNKFDAQKVHRALGLMGVDRPAIRRWQNLAGERAAEFEVTVSAMINQLWQEWLWHEATGWIEHGTSLINREQRPFVPKLVRPSEWVEPWKRYPDSPVRYVPASPPSARVVYALLTAFNPDV